MADLASFLDENPDLNPRQKDDGSSDTQESVALDVIVLTIGEKETLFAHFNEPFFVANDDILEIFKVDRPVANHFGRGHACEIRLRPSTKLISKREYEARTLLNHLPYAVSRPSMVPVQPGLLNPYTDKEMEWFGARGINVQGIRDAVQTSTYCSTSSPSTTCSTSTNTGTGTMVDDNYGDDNPNDDYASDDSNADDFNNG